MSTMKAQRTVAGSDDAQTGATPVAHGGNEQNSAESKPFEFDKDSFESGDPYNRTGQFLVEQLRRLEQGE